MENKYVGVYNSIVEDLLNVGRFKRSKKLATMMSHNEMFDIYKGVYMNYIRYFNKNCRISNVKHLFQTIDDWFRIDCSIKYVKYYTDTNGKLVSEYKINWR